MINPDEIMSIDELCEQACLRQLDSCDCCNRKVRKKFPIFAAGCKKHQTIKSPKILFVFRDPN
jgi:hypothetical protein